MATVLLMSPELYDNVQNLIQQERFTSKTANSVGKAMEQLDLRSLRRGLQNWEEQLRKMVNLIERARYQLSISALDARSEAASRYAAALEDECLRVGVRLTGHFPNYEAFPLVIKIDLTQEQVVIDKKKISALDPKLLAGYLEKRHKLFMQRDFDAKRFAGALALVYDVLTNGASGQPVSLSKVYALLSARTGPIGYSRQHFGIDIYRLRSETDLQYNGRRFRFGYARDVRDAISVPTGTVTRENLSVMIMEEVSSSEH